MGFDTSVYEPGRGITTRRPYTRFHQCVERVQIPIVYAAGHDIRLGAGAGASDSGSYSSQFGSGIGGKFPGVFNGRLVQSDECILASLSQVDAKPPQYTRADTLAFPYQAQEQVLSADLVMAKASGLIHRQ